MQPDYCPRKRAAYEDIKIYMFKFIGYYLIVHVNTVVIEFQIGFVTKRSIQLPHCWKIEYLTVALY